MAAEKTRGWCRLLGAAAGKQEMCTGTRGRWLMEMRWAAIPQRALKIECIMKIEKRNKNQCIPVNATVKQAVAGLSLESRVDMQLWSCVREYNE
jgi:hypothetical protein